MASSKPSEGKVSPSIAFRILDLLVRAVEGFFQAVFFPPKPRARNRSVGYWWQDKKGKWHPRVYMYSRNEQPPSS